MTRPLGLFLAAAAGIAMSAQARVNGELAYQLHDGITAAVISFSIGLAILSVIFLLVSTARRGLYRVTAALRDGQLRPWQILGGACGAFLVASQGLTVTTLGVAVFTVSVLTGQLISSLLVDRAGIGPGLPQPVTLRRLLGAGITLTAVVITVADQVTDLTGSALALLAGAAGFGIAWQQAVNGRVREAAGAALPATLINFTVGTAALLVPWAITIAIRGLPGSPPAQLWMYLGGPLGMVFIAVAATVVRATGVLLFGLGTVTGQLGGAILLDLLFPVSGRDQLNLNTAIGLLVALVGVFVGTLGQTKKS